MLIDKGFYDYDYEAVSEKAVRHEQSEERTNNMMKRFGFGKKEGQNSMSPEEIQKEVMSDSIQPKE